MMRALFAGFWAMILVAATAYYFSVVAGTRKSDDADKTSNVEIFNLDTTSVPVIRNNQIRGYILVSAVFTVSKDVSAGLPFPIEYQIRDALFETLFSDREMDIFQLDKIDMGKIRQSIKAKANSSYPNLVEDIKFQYFDFMTKNEVRDMQMRRY